MMDADHKTLAAGLHTFGQKSLDALHVAALHVFSEHEAALDLAEVTDHVLGKGGVCM